MLYFSWVNRWFYLIDLLTENHLKNLILKKIWKKILQIFFKNLKKMSRMKSSVKWCFTKWALRNSVIWFPNWTHIPCQFQPNSKKYKLLNELNLKLHVNNHTLNKYSTSFGYLWKNNYRTCACARHVNMQYAVDNCLLKMTKYKLCFNLFNHQRFSTGLILFIFLV